jgi:hypothetical protein
MKEGQIFSPNSQIINKNFSALFIDENIALKKIGGKEGA